jgi:hypothetical protein
MRLSATSKWHRFPAWLGPRSLAAADGGRVTVLREGGCVIGLFPGGSQPNLRWTHPALASAAASRRLCRPVSWSNLGGDRTWLSPEVGFFHPPYRETTVYLQPRAFETGDYRADDRDPNVIRLTNAAVVAAHAAGKRIPRRITKAVRLAANPLGGACPRGVEYVGYSLEVTLKISAKAVAPPQFAIWNLLQVPHGGERIIPTCASCRPTTFFGTIPAGDLRVTKRCISYQIRAAGEQKIAVPAVATTGRMAYLHRAGRSATLVVRSFQPDPSGIYADFPVGRPAETGFAVQSRNVDSHWGAFSEMEHHAPAIGGDTGLRRHRDVSQVWGFTGPREAIVEITQALCGASGSGPGT